MGGGGTGANAAVTVFAEVIVTVQVVPVHAPLQPVKVEPVAGVAVRLTVVPYAYVALLPMETGLTLPLPVPDLLTLRVNVCKAKLALTDFEEPIVTAQGPVPVHAPLQPVKVELLAGVGVRLTVAPAV